MPDAPEPAASAAARLTQMRQLARRFKVTEIYQGDPLECRLLARPIDRYASEADKITDGALFVFANGTNPEIGVLVESGPAGWSYAIVRISSAESKVELDGKVIATFATGDFRLVREGTYMAHTQSIQTAN